MTNMRNRLASLFSSMRVKLTFWYTCVLAVVLLIFAIATYSYLARATHQRTDYSLSETANSFVASFRSELADGDHSSDEAVREAARSFQFRDRQVLVFDEKRSVLLASDTTEHLPFGTSWFTLPAAQAELGKLWDAVSRVGRAYGTVFEFENSIRVLAVRVPGERQSYILLVANPLYDQQKTLAQVRNAFFVAIPLALLLASLGGYFLARKSLQPVVAMGEQAARIRATSLDERIVVPPHNHELGRLAIIFNDLLTRLDRAFAQQKRFMADASHELRTPVAVICGESEVALSGPSRDTEEYRESLAIVHDEARRLTRMVEDLFTLARADAGQYPLVPVDFYLDESMNECVRSVRSLAAQKGLQICYEAPEKEIAFRGDEALIRRMVLNLLHNAIKFTPEQGLVRISLKQNCSHCQVVISDTGQGIPVEAQPHVFERFFRVDKARARTESLNESGAGLGLSIAKWAAELHGGQVLLDHSDPQGSTFVISLPGVSSPRSA